VQAGNGINNNIIHEQLTYFIKPDSLEQTDQRYPISMRLFSVVFPGYAKRASIVSQFYYQDSKEALKTIAISSN